MSVSKFCIQHKVATLLAVIMITIFGLVFATQLQMSLMPEMEAPMAMVVCYYNGANPSDIEELITRPLESAVMSVSGVDEVSSTSADSMCQLQVTYVEGTDLDIAATKLREQFDRLSLPEDAIDPVIVNLNLSELMPTAMVALAGSDLAELQALAEDTVAPALERIDGVAQVTVNGGVAEKIAVELDATRAAGLGLSTAQVSQFLAAQNLLYPGGSMENGSKTLTVSTDAKFQSVEDVANMLLSLPTGDTVRLSEVADVSLETELSDAAAKVDGTSDFRYLRRVMIPICRPTLVTITILKIIECWNSYVWPRLITDDANYYLVSNGIQEIRENGFGRANIPAMMAAVVVISLPLILLFLLFRRQIMSGIARGGTKG